MLGEEYVWIGNVGIVGAMFFRFRSRGLKRSDDGAGALKGRALRCRSTVYLVLRFEFFAALLKLDLVATGGALRKIITDISYLPQKSDVKLL